MSDCIDDFRAVRAWKLDQSTRRKLDNTKALRDMGVSFNVKQDGFMLTISVAGKSVDFWPSTNRWKVRGENRSYRGTAAALVAWIRNREKPRCD